MAFKTSNHMRRHIRTVHAEIRYTCEHCPMTYGRRDKLRMHMERVHDVSNAFEIGWYILRQTFLSSQVDPDVLCVWYLLYLIRVRRKASGAQASPRKCPGSRVWYLFDKLRYPGGLQRTYVHHISVCDFLDFFSVRNVIFVNLHCREDYVCCNRDFRYHSFYNRHMFLAHGLSTNARVKPKVGVLMGKQRALRVRLCACWVFQYRLNRFVVLQKSVERCPKCEYVFATRKLKKQHMETCAGQVVIFEIEPVADATAPEC